MTEKGAGIWPEVEGNSNPAWGREVATREIREREKIELGYPV